MFCRPGDGLRPGGPPRGPPAGRRLPTRGRQREAAAGPAGASLHPGPPGPGPDAVHRSGPEVSNGHDSAPGSSRKTCCSAGRSRLVCWAGPWPLTAPLDSLTAIGRTGSRQTNPACGRSRPGGREVRPVVGEPACGRACRRARGAAGGGRSWLVAAPAGGREVRPVVGDPGLRLLPPGGREVRPGVGEPGLRPVPGARSTPPVRAGLPPRPDLRSGAAGRPWRPD